MKEYVKPYFESLEISSTELFAAYAGCEATTWLTGSDAGEFYCASSAPDQIYGGNQCYDSPRA